MLWNIPILRVNCTLIISFIVYFLDKLDGIRPMKRRREESPPFLPSDDDDPYDEREEDMRIGKKRVSVSSLTVRTKTFFYSERTPPYPPPPTPLLSLLEVLIAWAIYFS